jgi:DNA replication licensing factor MCM7
MASQESNAGGVDAEPSSSAYPDYEQDVGTLMGCCGSYYCVLYYSILYCIILYYIMLYCIAQNSSSRLAAFSEFLNEHTILRVVRDHHDSDGDDGDEDNNEEERRQLEPVNGDLDVERVPCYPPLLQRIKNRDYFDATMSTFLIEIPLRELEAWDGSRGGDLAQRATENALRYHSIFCQVIDSHLERLSTSANNDASTTRQQQGLLRDTIDIFQEQRLRQQQLNLPAPEAEVGGVAEEAAAANNASNATLAFPPILLRRYELRILPRGRPGTLFPFVRQYIRNTIKAVPGVSLRHVRAKSMGRLVTITGMVVRASDVKPYCHVATYSCDDCGAELYQVLQGQREFMPQRNCPSCAQQQRRTRFNTLQLQTRGSKFVKFQEVKLQELPSQVPMGHVPRSLSVYCRGELTRMCSPGDVITVDGVFLPQRAEGGYRGLRAGLMATLFVEAQHLDVHKKSFDESLLDTLSEQDSERLDKDIQKIATSDDPIGILASSIAPEIFGHADIKRALLLQLTGGVTRKLNDGMKIRGDINICLMGDPGVAKSQLLKHVATIAPRGVYTTGKGSSGVGLTAAITKDTVTGELSLEGGALVLADRGICAIVSTTTTSTTTTTTSTDG